MLSLATIQKLFYSKTEHSHFCFNFSFILWLINIEESKDATESDALKIKHTFPCMGS